MTGKTNTATERLRALLDERGVEYRVSATGYSIDIGPSITAYANRTDTTLDVSLRGVTPAQAIDATLGPGTCRDLSGTGANGEQVFNCSECGCVLSLYDRDGSNNLCTSFIFDYPRYCPECGRRVVE